MESYSREYYEKYGERQSFWEKPPNAPLVFHEKLRSLRLLRFCPEKEQKILDCGCGDGYLSVLLSTKCPKSVLGLDLSLNRLKHFKEKAIEHHIPRLAGDSRKLPFKDESFEIIFVSELLEHVGEDDQMLKEILRSLKKGGRFVLSVPYKEMVNTVICPECHHEFYRHGHLRSYDKPTLRDQLERNGFNRIRFTLSNNDKTRKMRGRRFLPLNWVVNIDAFFSFLFPEQSRYLIAIAEK